MTSLTLLNKRTLDIVMVQKKRDQTAVSEKKPLFEKRLN